MHKQWMREIETIEKGKDFLTYTARSEQELFAEMHLMCEVHRRRLPHIAEDAWRSAFLTKSSLLFEKSTEEYYFVVRAFRCAVLLWPAVRREINIFSRDETASSLAWRACFDFDEWEVMEIKVQSPLSMMLEDYV